MERVVVFYKLLEVGYLVVKRLVVCSNLCSEVAEQAAMLKREYGPWVELMGIEEDGPEYSEGVFDEQGCAVGRCYGACATLTPWRCPVCAVFLCGPCWQTHRCVAERR